MFAIAIYDPDDIWEVKRFHSDSAAAASHPSQEVAVEPGYVMVGGGAQAHWSSNGSLLFASYPKNETTWRAQAKDQAIEDAATISAYAIGLKCKVKGVKVQSGIVQSKSYPSNRPIATVAPSSGYVMAGGGAALTFGGPGLLLTTSYPRDSNLWEGQGKDHIKGDSGTIDVYCIGVKVVDAP